MDFMKFRRVLLLTVLLAVTLTAVTGGTIAWFTDSVTSANNVIKSGNLDVELYYQAEGQNDWKKVEADTSLFKKNALWEPGYTEWIKLKIVNEGSLALKYQFDMNVTETSSTNVDGNVFKLSDYIYAGIAYEDKTITDRDSAMNAVNGTAAALSSTYQPKAGSLEPDAEDVVTMVVYMPTTVGNEANHAKDSAAPTITLGIKLEATQLTSESDSFNNQYDAEAVLPGEENTIQSGNVTLNLPDDAPAGLYKLFVERENVTTDDEGTSTAAYDISLTRDGKEIHTSDDGVMYPVKIELDKGLSIQSFTHNGNPITDYEYDIATGILSFETATFSPFEVKYIKVSDNFTTDGNGKLTGGVFKGYNPAKTDPSLAEENSEYIAVNYTVNDETYYIVTKRDDTLVLAASDTVYTPENKNYTAKEASGKLWSEISGVQDKAHTTVYLLPGTYNEGTTINVYSSMDIIGLGDKDSVKVIKTSSSDSNRHLFNCNGTKADYIEVSLRNLYLDATAKTTGGKDNAAVQSIRKTKVKCYDLTIVKGTGLSAVAFYVNGNNAVDGVKYPAYLYAENCSLNAASTFGVVTTNGSYKFYHSGLTYGGTAYTNNSGSIKNVSMDENDWDWE